MWKLINKINDNVAIKVTLTISTMWCAYAFLLFSFLPTVAPSTQNVALYISNVFQLVFLPLIMVGQNLLSRNSEERATNDHAALMNAMDDLKIIMAEQQTEDTNITIIQNVLTSMHEKLGGIETHLTK